MWFYNRKRGIKITLSKREKEINNLRQQNYSERQIAAKLNLSKSTVHTYLERIERKRLIRKHRM